MIYRLTVPLGIEDNDEVRVLEWHVDIGTRFAVGTLLVELETHKALIEVRAGQTGLLRERCVGAGEWCPLGGLLAVVADEPGELPGDDWRELDAEFLIG